MSFICEHCKKEFTTYYILLNHQRKAKYCLKIQGKLENKFIVEDDFVCDICEKTFATKQTLTNHINVCKQKNVQLIFEQNIKLKTLYKSSQEQLEKKDIHIKELEDRLERALNKALEQPTNVSTYNNNSTNNIQLATFNITTENTAKILKDKMKREHLYFGMGGFADFAKEHLLTLENGEMIYKCYDVSRQIFKYVDNNGVLIKDVKAKKLMSLIREPVVLRILEIINDYNKEYDKLNKEIYDMNMDTRELRKKIEKIDYYRKEALKLKTDINLMEENNKFAIELSTRLTE
jgi:hypothetical protein